MMYRFYMPVAVLDNHLDGMGVLDPYARCLLAWDVDHAEEVDQVKKEVKAKMEEEEGGEEAEKTRENIFPPP